MVDTVVSPAPVEQEGEARGDLIQAFRWMLLARILDEKFASLYRGGKIYGGVFLGKGQEALSVAIGQNLRKGDIFSPLIRDTSGRLAFGEPLLDGVRTYLGSPLGPMRARDGNVHRGRPKEGLLPMISHLGATISVVNGMLMGRRFHGVEGVVGAASIGEGATSTGAFHEALNQAAVERLPLVLVIADNRYAYSTPRSKQFACGSLINKAPGYGVTGYEVNGTDLWECFRALRQAIRSAREGKGPQMIVANLLRLCGHGEHDDAGYVDPKIRDSDIGRDCIKAASDRLMSEGWATEAEMDEWRKECVRQVEEAVAVVQREGGPDPFSETWTALATAGLQDGFEQADK